MNDIGAAYCTRKDDIEMSNDRERGNPLSPDHREEVAARQPFGMAHDPQPSRGLPQDDPLVELARIVSSGDAYLSSDNSRPAGENTFAPQEIPPRAYVDPFDNPAGFGLPGTSGTQPVAPTVQQTAEPARVSHQDASAHGRSDYRPADEVSPPVAEPVRDPYSPQPAQTDQTVQPAFQPQGGNREPLGIADNPFLQHLNPEPQVQQHARAPEWPPQQREAQSDPLPDQQFSRQAVQQNPAAATTSYGNPEGNHQGTAIPPVHLDGRSSHSDQRRSPVQIPPLQSVTPDAGNFHTANELLRGAYDNNPESVPARHEPLVDKTDYSAPPYAAEEPFNPGAIPVAGMASPTEFETTQLGVSTPGEANPDGLDNKPARSKMVMAAGIAAAVIFVGGGLAYTFSGSDTTTGNVAVFNAMPGKIKTPGSADSGRIIPNQDKTVYDRVSGNQGNSDRVIIGDASEAPVNVAAVKRNVSRIITAGTEGNSAGTLVQSGNGAVAAGQTALRAREVRTFSIRPDGTIIGPSGSKTQPTPSESQMSLALNGNSLDTGTSDILARVRSQVGNTDANAGQLLQQGANVAQALPRANPLRSTAVTSLNQPLIAQIQQAITVPVVTNSASARVPQGAPVILPVLTQTNPLQASRSLAPVQTTSVPVTGGYAVQVSSRRTRETALSSFQSLQSRFPALLATRSPDVKQVNLGDRGIFYRVRIGPMATRQDANDFCKTMKNAGGDCIVAKF